MFVTIDFGCPQPWSEMLLLQWASVNVEMPTDQKSEDKRKRAQPKQDVYINCFFYFLLKLQIGELSTLLALPISLLARQDDQGGDLN